jgi:hypothetical protein
LFSWFFRQTKEGEREREQKIERGKKGGKGREKERNGERKRHLEKYTKYQTEIIILVFIRHTC